MQAASSDAVGASLVFLHLLKGQADRLPELFLAQAKHIPAQPHAGTDVDIDRLRLVALLATRPARLLVHHHLWSIALAKARSEMTNYTIIGDEQSGSTENKHFLRCASIRAPVAGGTAARPSAEPECDRASIRARFSRC